MVHLDHIRRLLVATLYERLLDIVTRDGIRVNNRAQHVTPDDPHGEYAKPSNGLPAIIWVYHPRRSDEIVEPNDVVTLAVMYGYHMSVVNETRAQDYDDAIANCWREWADLPGPLKQAILAETKLAWDNARIILDGMGFDDWRFFEDRRHSNWTEYVRRLWPPA